MTPYYEDDAVTIYHGDCRDVLPDMTECFDVVLTDPPFFMPAEHYASRINWQRSWSDTSILAAFWSSVCDLTIPRIRRSGHLLVFCNADSYPVFYPEMYRRWDKLVSLVWDKGRVGLGKTWRRQHELIIAARWAEAEWNDDGKLRADVLRHEATKPSDRTHPVEKPAGLLRDLLIPTVTAGGVLDPFMGSGTTLEAAKQLGVRGVGIEGEERYCEIAARRMEQEVLAL